MPMFRLVFQLYQLFSLPLLEILQVTGERQVEYFLAGHCL